MSKEEIHQQLTELYKAAEKAHESAHEDTHGVDPDWPIWYAGYLLDPLRKLLKAGFTKSELVYLLVLVDKEQRLRAPGADWATYFARFIIERYI